MKMSLNDSPFTLLTNSNNNNILFNNPNQSNHQNLSDSDFFLLNNNDNQNCQSKTKQRFAFYNNGTPSQIKQCLDYFLNSKNANINFICFTGNHIPLNFNENDNESDGIKNKNTSINEIKNSHLSYNGSDTNNNLNKNGKLKEEDDVDCSCAPPCKKSNNSCFSESSFNSSVNSNSNINCFDMMGNIDLLTNGLGSMKINNGKRHDKEDINKENKNRKNENLYTLRRIAKIKTD